MGIQSTYLDRQPVGYAGQIADLGLADVISREVEDSGGIGFGLAVIQGSADHGVKLGAAGEFIGLSVRDVSLPPGQSDTYAQNDTAAVMIRGVMWAKALAAVTKGDPVYYTSAGGLTNVPGSRSAEAGAVSGTGNGAMGAITVGATAKLGAHVLKITKAASDAGDFEVIDPEGDVVGVGTVGVAFSGGGLSFTLADGSTDFAVGATITISVSGGNTPIEGARWDSSAAQNALGKVRLS